MTLLSGAAEVEIDGEVTLVAPRDSTYVKARIVHCFRNTSRDEPMVILWVYSSAYAPPGRSPTPARPSSTFAADAMVRD